MGEQTPRGQDGTNTQGSGRDKHPGVRTGRLKPRHGNTSGGHGKPLPRRAATRGTRRSATAAAQTRCESMPPHPHSARRPARGSAPRPDPQPGRRTAATPPASVPAKMRSTGVRRRCCPSSWPRRQSVTRPCRCPPHLRIDCHFHA
eukprot:scaffold4840_cov115-Isochrysis_galbana.AAC.7